MGDRGGGGGCCGFVPYSDDIKMVTLDNNSATFTKLSISIHITFPYLLRYSMYSSSGGGTTVVGVIVLLNFLFDGLEEKYSSLMKY